MLTLYMWLNALLGTGFASFLNGICYECRKLGFLQPPQGVFVIWCNFQSGVYFLQDPICLLKILGYGQLEFIGAISASEKGSTQ